MTDKKKWVKDLREPIGSMGEGLNLSDINIPNDAENLSTGFSDLAYIKQNLDALTDEEQQDPMEIFKAFLPDEMIIRSPSE